MAVEQFTSFRIDLQGSLDSTVAKRIPDPPGFSSSVAKEKVRGIIVLAVLSSV